MLNFQANPRFENEVCRSGLRYMRQIVNPRHQPAENKQLKSLKTPVEHPNREYNNDTHSI